MATIFRFCSIFLCSASQRVQPTVGNSLLLSYTLHPNNTQIARTGNNNKCPAGWFYFLSLYHSKVTQKDKTIFKNKITSVQLALFFKCQTRKSFLQFPISGIPGYSPLIRVSPGWTFLGDNNNKE